MLSPAIPANERDRLAALRRYQILDTPPEPAFDALTALVSRLLQVPVSLVSLVDESRQWFKSRHGLDVPQMPREVSFCGHVVATERSLVVEDTTADVRFADNPLVTGAPFIRFYAGIPLRTEDGFILGTLCGIDWQPRRIDAESLKLLENLAAQTVAQLELRRQVRLGVEQQMCLQAALERVERSNADLLTILDLLEVGVGFVDEHQRLRSANDRFLSLLALDPVKVEGLSCDGMLEIAPAYAKQLRPMLERPVDRRSRLPMIVDYPNGRRRHLQLEVWNDPRDASRRLVFVYDMTEVNTLRETTNQLGPGRLIGSGPLMAEVFRAIHDIAKGDWTTLIEGESGTGKELVARAIHAASPRRGSRFVAINCAGLTETLLSSQLFGHRRGSFTGALADQEGFFEAAHGGTLLLDEIGEMPLAIQGHLLRVLQDKEVLRVGETRPRKVDVRILAATNRNLDVQVAEGRFRRDLMYRIRVARISIPPLRERREDIVQLAEAFLAEARVASGKTVRDLTPEALAVLAAYQWPGNVRELKAAVEHAVIRCQGNFIGVDDLPPEVPQAAGHGEPAAALTIGEETTSSVQVLLDAEEKERYVDALRQARGHRQRAARLLGVSRSTFYRRLEALGIDLGRKR